MAKYVHEVGSSRHDYQGQKKFKLHDRIRVNENDLHSLKVYGTCEH